MIDRFQGGYMRQIININQDWLFSLKGKEEKVNVPHTWNNIDGQDGGGDYFRGKATYTKTFKKPELKENQELYLEVNGANSSSDVIINGNSIFHHDGGYSTYRVNLTEYLKEENTLTIEVDNSVNTKVYPQRADFTFYGGLYRDVNFIIVNKEHFDLDFYGSKGIKVTSSKRGNDFYMIVTSYTNSKNKVEISLLDAENKTVATMEPEKEIKLGSVHIWDGLNDPYLYTVKADLVSEKGEILDTVSVKYGFRTFSIDPKKGFFLNGKSYPLRGVSRHQDRLGLGNAITKKEHDEDMELIREIGANTVRLAHYQHDEYFLDLCDKYGMVVWAEIPFISEYLVDGDENAISQMKELIYQQNHHASIVTWGIANEITIANKNKKARGALLHKLNDLCHKIDPSRPTTLACYAMCGPFNKTAAITDIVSWNLYLGWYVPGFFLNDLWFSFYHLTHPSRALGLSEYGAEGMPNLHAIHPKRFDNTEEYQCKYHEFLLKCFERHPYLWATHVWNMFDFGSDGRNQGDDAGKNHKGLVTFDRKLKKDAFYLYKAYWSKEQFFHLCSTRYINRHESKTIIKVYSNSDKELKIYHDDKLVAAYKNSKVFSVKVPLHSGANKIKVTDGVTVEEMTINKVEKKDMSYVVKTGNSMSWEKTQKEED